MFRQCVRKYTTNIKYYEGLSKVNNFRENRSYGKSVRVKSIKKFYELTREIPEHNIDSHDNSLYIKEPPNLPPYNKDSKTFMNDNFPINMNNYNYSSHYLVKDFNRRWKKNLTMEEYYKSFKL
tara:strand:+ start:104 stop:472 length:369 start_codon:yes stop_codon:yes gene_type:complete